MIAMLRAILYWTGATVLVLALMAGIAGVAGLAYSTGLPFHRMWAGFFVIVGALFVGGSFRSPRLLWRRWFVRSADVVGPEADPDGLRSFFPEFIGLGLIVAGLGYAATGSVWVLILVMWVAQLPLLWLRFCSDRTENPSITDAPGGSE